MIYGIRHWFGKRRLRKEQKRKGLYKKKDTWSKKNIFNYFKVYLGMLGFMILAGVIYYFVTKYYPAEDTKSGCLCWTIYYFIILLSWLVVIIYKRAKKVRKYEKSIKEKNKTIQVEPVIFELDKKENEEPEYAEVIED